ncbi:MAG: M23 family metallopeptidase, partial [Pusillimonas sp.]
NGDQVHDAIWFQPDDESGGYYGFDGKSMKGAFLRSALKVSRISSTFGMRRHPIHGNWRGHKGVDYAAPTGTPIYATADGVIDNIGRMGGYGNTIVLKHGNDVSTYYAHQSRFAAGLKKGDRIEQGQLIGYVGSTGWSTGPHLHYEFRVKGTPIDPLSVDLPVAKVLTPQQMTAFQAKLGTFRSHLNFLAVLQDEEDDLNDTEISLASAQ